MGIVEPATPNSGSPEGVLVRRHRAPLPNDPSDHYLPDDLNIGKDITLYGRTYHIVDCDEFTRNYCSKVGMVMGEKEDYPEDLHSRALAAKELAKRRITEPKPQMDAKKQFLVNDKNVLEFFCLWKESRMFAEPRKFKLDYFLADDQIQIVEMHGPNCGRDQSGPFLRKQKLRKPDDKSKNIVRDPTQPLGACYHWRDLKVGDIIDVLNRPFLLYDCDPHTKEFYRQQLGVIFEPLQLYHKERSVVPVADAPYNGWGSEEDSLLSSKTLIPRPPKVDVAKMMADDKSVIRFAAKLVSRTPEDKDRDFVVTYYLADDTLGIFEPPKRNSGIVGGKFLERGRVKKFGTNEYFKGGDLYVGAKIAVNGHTFVLLETDEFSLNVMESRTDVFEKSDLERIHAHLRDLFREEATAAGGLEQLFHSMDRDGNGTLSLEEFTHALRERTDLTDQEIIHLMRYYDTNGDRRVSYDELLAVVGDPSVPLPRNAHDIEREIRAHEPPDVKPHLVRDAIKDSLFSLNESLRARRGQLLASFRDFDLDRDGKLSLQEFRTLLTSINLALSDEQRDQLVNHFFDDDVVRSTGNAVTYQRFVALLQREPTARVILKGVNTF